MNNTSHATIIMNGQRFPVETSNPSLSSFPEVNLVVETYNGVSADTKKRTGFIKGVCLVDRQLHQGHPGQIELHDPKTNRSETYYFDRLVVGINHFSFI